MEYIQAEIRISPVLGQNEAEVTVRVSLISEDGIFR